MEQNSNKMIFRSGVLLVFLLLFASSFFMQAQTKNSLYYDTDGKKTTSTNASFIATEIVNGQYAITYLNGKPYFKGKIIAIDSNQFAKSIFADTCIWYFKNGERRFTYIYTSDGKLNGISQSFYESGNLWKEQDFKNGELENNTFIEYLEDGQRYDTYLEEFTSNTGDWDIAQNENEDIRIEQGFLKLLAKTKSGTSRYKYIKFDKEDFIIESAFEFERLPKGAQGGIIFGFKDWNNFNFYFIDHENVSIGTVYEGIKNYAIEDMFSAAIESKGKNGLKIISNGSDLVYTINGTKVYKSSRYPFYGHNFGIALLGKSTVHIDHLAFKQVSYTAMGQGRVSREQKDIDVKATGTGFFIHPSGILATNYHVIENGKQFVVDVLDSNTGKYTSYRASLLMKDMDNDLAILKISESTFTPMFSTLEFAMANNNILELGSSIFTLGFPLALAGMGSGEVKFSDGKVSAKTGYNGALNSFQTTIPVQPGNSGGPIFNVQGEFIGVINATISKADNVSYGIKNNFLMNLIQTLPDNIALENTNKLSSLSLEEKIKILKKYIVLIKVK